MKTHNIPDGYEDTGLIKNGHVIIRCTKTVLIEGNRVQCSYTTRNCKNPPEHICRGVRPVPVEERNVDIMKDIANFIGKASLALCTVEKDYFMEFMSSLIELGQANPSTPANLLIPTINRKNIRPSVINAGKVMFNKKIELAHNDPAVTMSLDAGTLSRKHLIDICLTSPSLKPIFYKTIPKAGVGIKEYQEITEAELTEIFQNYKVNIVALVTDNLPVQVIALAHWSPESILNTSQDQRIRKILFFPCLCHSTQLIIECTEENDTTFSALNGTLRSMIALLRNNTIKDLIQGNCPQFAATRWLSRMESIEFILHKKEKILGIVESIDSFELPDNIKRGMRQLFTEENFGKINDLGKLAFPFYVLVKIFEKNNARQFIAVPCFEQLKTFIKQQIEDESMLQYHPTLIELLNQLKIRKKKTLHWELLIACFVLTLPGRLWFRQKIRFEHTDAVAICNKELQYQFKKLRLDYLVEDDGDLDRIDIDYFLDDSEDVLIEANGGTEEDDTDDIFSYRSTALNHINVPLPPSHEGGLYESIVATLNEISLRVNGSAEFIDESFSFYIYNDSLFNKFSKFKDIKSHPEIGWLQEVLNPKLKNLANVAFHLLTVVASETSVERCFSQQKLILSELRLKSKDDLINARFTLAD